MIYRKYFVLLCIAGFLLYLPGMWGPVVFDSTLALTANPAMYFDATVFDEWRAATLSSGSGPLGRPISMFSFALNQALFGDSGWAIKCVNVLIHLGIGALAYRLGWHLLCRAPALRMEPALAEKIALVSAALWLLHPVQLSSVLYSVQRMEQLSALFILLGLLAYSHYRVRWLDRMPSAEELSRAVLAVLLCTLLAVYSKEDGILLLPLLAWVELILFQARWGGRTQRWMLLLAALGSSLPLLAPLILAAWQPEYLIAQYEVRPWSLSDRLLTQLRMLWTYVQWFYLPWVPAYGLHHDDIAISTGWLEPISTFVAGLGWLAVLALCSQWRRWPLAVFGVGFFLLSHTIESSFLPLEMVYEHRNYLGSLGLAWLLVGSLARLGRREWLKPGLLLVGFYLCASLLLRSYTWGEEVRMSSFHLRNHPDSIRAVYHYANTQLRLAESEANEDLQREGILRARRYYEHMLELDPRDVPALVTLVYIDGRWFPELESSPWLAPLEDAFETRHMNPADNNALLLLTRAMIEGPGSGLSAEHYTAMLEGLARRYPQKAEYLRYLSSYYGSALEDYPRAIEYARQALARDPAHLAARVELIAWLQRSGESGRSVEEIGELMRYDKGLKHLPLVRSMLAP